MEESKEPRRRYCRLLETVKKIIPTKEAFMEWVRERRQLAQRVENLQCALRDRVSSQAALKAVRKNNGVLQVGSQQRSDANFRRACMLVRNGYIGKVTKVLGVNPA